MRSRRLSSLPQLLIWQTSSVPHPTHLLSLWVARLSRASRRYRWSNNSDNLDIFWQIDSQFLPKSCWVPCRCSPECPCTAWCAAPTAAPHCEHRGCHWNRQRLHRHYTAPSAWHIARWFASRAATCRNRVCDWQSTPSVHSADNDASPWNRVLPCQCRELWLRCCAQSHTHRCWKAPQRAYRANTDERRARTTRRNYCNRWQLSCQLFGYRGETNWRGNHLPQAFGGKMRIAQREWRSLHEVTKRRAISCSFAPSASSLCAQHGWRKSPRPTH